MGSTTLKSKPQRPRGSPWCPWSQGQDECRGGPPAQRGSPYHGPAVPLPVPATGCLNPFSHPVTGDRRVWTAQRARVCTPGYVYFLKGPNFPPSSPSGTDANSAPSSRLRQGCACPTVTWEHAPQTRVSRNAAASYTPGSHAHSGVLRRSRSTAPGTCCGQIPGPMPSTSGPSFPGGPEALRRQHSSLGAWTSWNQPPTAAFPKLRGHPVG